MKLISYKDLWSIQEPILAFAAIIEVYLHTSGILNRWRDLATNWWANLQLMTWPQRGEISVQFQKLFSLIYGHKTFSRRRVISAIISSLFFTIFFYFLFVRINQSLFDIGDIDYRTDISPVFMFLNHRIYSDYPIFYPYTHPIRIAALIFDALMLNMIPDFISLSVTAWLIKVASAKKVRLSLLLILDLVFMTLIWICWHGTRYYFETLLSPPGRLPITQYYTVADPDRWAFVATTYSTSIMWIIFLIVIASIIIMKQVSPLFVKLLESRFVNELPIATMVGIVCLISWLVLFLAKAFLE